MCQHVREDFVHMRSPLCVASKTNVKPAQLQRFSNTSIETLSILHVHSGPSFCSAAVPLPAFGGRIAMADDLAKLQAKNEALKATLKALTAPPAAPVAESTKKAESKLKIIALQEKTFAEQQEIERLELEAKQLLARAKEHSRKKKDIEKEIDIVRNADKPVWETVGMQTITYRDPFHTGVSKRTPTGACSSLLSLRVARLRPTMSSHPARIPAPSRDSHLDSIALQAATSRHRAFQQQPTAPHTVRVAIMLTSQPGRSSYWQAALRSCHRRSLAFLRMLFRGVCSCARQ
jgi:hypothetical protein